MDYTIRPENNMNPSTSNFEYLAGLYGGRNVAAASSIQSPETTPDSDSASDQGKKGKKGGRRRILHKSDMEEVHLIHLEEEGMMLLRQYRF